MSTLQTHKLTHFVVTDTMLLIHWAMNVLVWGIMSQIWGKLRGSHKRIPSFIYIS